MICVLVLVSLVTTAPTSWRTTDGVGKEATREVKERPNQTGLEKDVGERNPILVKLANELREMSALRDREDTAEMSELFGEMLEQTVKLEREALGGKHSVSARALLDEAREICTKAGIDVNQSLRVESMDSPLARLEARRRVLKDEIDRLEDNASVDSQRRTENLRGDFMELTERIQSLRERSSP
jgi:hypothetical protein